MDYSALAGIHDLPLKNDKTGTISKFYFKSGLKSLMMLVADQDF